MDFKYVLKIFIIFFLILSLIIFINSIGLHFNEPKQSKKLLDVITLEGMDTMKAFCDTHSGYDLEKSCQKLTKYNCGLTSCCVWAGDKKCKAGNVSGPLFNSDSSGKTIPIDHYYFQNKCYGEKCPN